MVAVVAGEDGLERERTRRGTERSGRPRGSWSVRPERVMRRRNGAMRSRAMVNSVRR